MITELRCTADALPCAGTLDASDYAWETCTMKKGAAPISLAGSQLICGLISEAEFLPP